ncbi:hypothetical protein GC163_15085 [bacterium]|nr:hypothetical protein [bacterium]
MSDGLRKNPQILVLEPLPYWAPALRWELEPEISVSTTTQTVQAERWVLDHPRGLVIWQLADDVAATVRWLTRCLAADQVPRTIVCGPVSSSGLSETLRMLGVMSISDSRPSPQELAAYCRRIL